MKHRPQPINMFAATADDTPLFSGTAQHATLERYDPKPAPLNMFVTACPVCYGTGQIKPYKNKPARPWPTCQH